MKIPLTQGLFTEIDEEDFELVSKYKWHANGFRKNEGFYARAYDPRLRAQWKYPMIYMHRLLLGFPEGKEIDHINHNTLDNRKNNLRISTRSQNSKHLKLGKNNTSGFKGIYKRKATGKWMVTIQVDGKCIYLGDFSDKLEAASTYDMAATKYFGEFACPNNMLDAS